MRRVSDQRMGRWALKLNASATQTLTTGVEATINLDTIEKVTGVWTTDLVGHTLTIPVDGWYHIACGLGYAANVTGSRRTIIRDGGGANHGLLRNGASNTGNTEQTYALEEFFTAGTVLHLAGVQDSGGNLLTAAMETGGQPAWLEASYLRAA